VGLPAVLILVNVANINKSKSVLINVVKQFIFCWLCAILKSVSVSYWSFIGQFKEVLGGDLIKCVLGVHLSSILCR